MEAGGKPVVASGTLVLSAGESGVIDLPIGPTPVTFKNDAGQSRINFNKASNVIEIFNADNFSLGAYLSPTLTTPTGSFTFRMALWSMGSPVTGRVLHYTVS